LKTERQREQRNPKPNRGAAFTPRPPRQIMREIAGTGGMEAG
jgi:hypothetical protein